MEILSALFVIGLITLIGHGIWLLLAKIYRAIFSEPEAERAAGDERSAAQPPHKRHCTVCGAALIDGDSFCHFCGRARPSGELMADLATIARQLDRFLSQGRLDAETHKLLMDLVEEERAQLIAPVRRIATMTRHEAEPKATQPAPVKPASQQPPPTPIGQFVLAVEKDVVSGDRDLSEIAAATKALPIVVAEIPSQPRRSFTEMLETFMEESSVRWGELVGGLLIIGCSIVLVVRLWSEIAARPFLQFYVFIVVFMSLFGIGFYRLMRCVL